MTRLDVLAVVAVVLLGGLTAAGAVLTVRRARDPRWRRDQWIAHNATAGSRTLAAGMFALWCGTLLVAGAVTLFYVHPLLGVALLIAGAAQATFAVYLARVGRRPPEDGWFDGADAEPDEQSRLDRNTSD
ncbi:hypothetical protein [Naasia aerilata]|uniref:Integral membrane protein n=1 Tax=Naasia aerilata TaxID=1162966 RepID=A0ABN6XI93_9MICO|nr:hypothetical protein [Naasia aerilata]BDZ44632.1 hypothetical protein GCM10025866_05410 [Naasia aerilata]